MMQERVFGVTEVNRYIKGLLDMDDYLTGIYVKGELSNYKIYPSGHHYFTLKDAEGSLRSVMFKREASKLVFRPENGMSVIAYGRITVYPRDGQYQLYCNELTPEGAGSLHIAFEQLKAKLYKEGLFDTAHKKTLPKFPSTIAIITSSAGAAVRDMIRILGRRSPMVKVKLLPVRVQGEEAPAEIVGAIRYANRYKVADLIITGRGGGSIEDLWAFNDERVARAIYDSEIPVISAVGHEPDITIADFVADVRASTPSNAAEIAVPDSRELMSELGHMELRMQGAIIKKIDAFREKINSLACTAVMRNPMNYIEEKRMALDKIVAQLLKNASSVISIKKAAFIHLASTLDAISPLKVLGRGYSITTDMDGYVIKSVEDVSMGERIRLKLNEGSLQCIIDAVLSEGKEYSNGRNEF